jgi:hypothetical protein
MLAVGGSAGCRSATEHDGEPTPEPVSPFTGRWLGARLGGDAADSLVLIVHPLAADSFGVWGYVQSGPGLAGSGHQTGENAVQLLIDVFVPGGASYLLRLEAGRDVLTGTMALTRDLTASDSVRFHFVPPNLRGIQGRYIVKELDGNPGYTLAMVADTLHIDSRGVLQRSRMIGTQESNCAITTSGFLERTDSLLTLTHAGSACGVGARDSLRVRGSRLVRRFMFLSSVVEEVYVRE